jgi:hypothetical protein
MGRQLALVTISKASLSPEIWRKHGFMWADLKKKPIMTGEGLYSHKKIINMVMTWGWFSGLLLVCHTHGDLMKL